MFETRLRAALIAWLVAMTNPSASMTMPSSTKLRTTSPGWVPIARRVPISRVPISRVPKASQRNAAHRF